MHWGRRVTNMVRKRSVYACTGLGDGSMGDQRILSTYTLLFRKKFRKEARFQRMLGADDGKQELI